MGGPKLDTFSSSLGDGFYSSIHDTHHQRLVPICPAAPRDERMQDIALYSQQAPSWIRERLFQVK